jgi:ArsR family transcriptional regulator
MSTRLRPAGCCTTPNEPIALPRADHELSVAMFKALADATRLDVFRLIAAQDEPICACDVTDRFDVSQPTISHHLKVLREAGLITVSRRGVWAYYAADPRGLALLRNSIESFSPELLAVAS